MRGFFYGGQAVMEGVMMRGRRIMAVAVRDPGGEIVMRAEPLGGWLAGGWPARVPLLRGVLLLGATLQLGMRALLYSASVTAAEPAAAREEPPLPATAGWRALALSLTLAVGLFFLLPALLVGLLDRFIASALVSNLLEGGLRLALLIGYLALIGRAPEIQRVFGYHGAEHKTINAHEAGAPLTPAGVRPFGLEHPRCGTGFLLVVVLLSLVAFLPLGQPPLPLRLASRVVLLPAIAAVAYEYIRLTAAFYHHRWARWLAAPSLALQRLTTREPDDAMLEVAIAALRRVLADEAAPVRPAPALATAGAAADEG